MQTARLVVVLGLILSACSSGGESTPSRAWVANRGGGELALVDVDTFQVERMALPAGGEPMYANFSPLGGGLVWVGDRGGDQMLAFDARTKELITTVPAAEGVFHQWVEGNTLAVNADVARETHVYTLSGRDASIDAVIPMPSDLAAMADAKPHDVFVSSDEESIYVTYIGLLASSEVVRFERGGGGFSEAARATVGGDAHLYLTLGRLFVPCQESNQVVVLDPNTLAEVETLEVPGAHGITAHAGRIYVGNINMADASVVTVIDASSLAIIDLPSVRPPASATGAPHNLWFDESGDRLFMTHSGATASSVSTYMRTDTAISADASPVNVVGANPFGLTVVPAL